MKKKYKIEIKYVCFINSFDKRLNIQSMFKKNFKKKRNI